MNKTESELIFYNLTDQQLYDFYNAWQVTIQSGMILANRAVDDVLQKFKLKSHMPVIDCHMALLNEIANRWSKNVQSKYYGG